MESETSKKRRLEERTMNVEARESANAKDLVRFGGSTDAMNAIVIANGMMGEDNKVAALATVKKVAALAMSKAIDKISATVKNQDMFGRATSLEKKEASDTEIATSLERRLKSELEIVEVVCFSRSQNEIEVIHNKRRIRPEGKNTQNQGAHIETSLANPGRFAKISCYFLLMCFKHTRYSHSEIDTTILSRDRSAHSRANQHAPISHKTAQCRNRTNAQFSKVGVPSHFGTTTELICDTIFNLLRFSLFRSMYHFRYTNIFCGLFGHNKWKSTNKHVWPKCAYHGCGVNGHTAELCWEDPNNAKLCPHEHL